MIIMYPFDFGGTANDHDEQGSEKEIRHHLPPSSPFCATLAHLCEVLASRAISKPGEEGFSIAPACLRNWVIRIWVA